MYAGNNTLSTGYITTGYNPLERIVTGGYTTVSMDSIEQDKKIVEEQRNNHYHERFQIVKKEYDLNTSKDYHVFPPQAFLQKDRPVTKFVGKAEEIRNHIVEAFEETTGKLFPENVLITIANEKTLAKKHGNWQKGIQGFSVNKNGQGVSEVFVLNGAMDQVMLTLGHEIGHVISPTLPDSRDEEAKAYAFSLAWMKVIIDKNIAGLKHCINPNPAQNGLHDVAFNFVEQVLASGKNAMEIFHLLREKTLSITRTIEQIIIN